MMQAAAAKHARTGNQKNSKPNCEATQEALCENLGWIWLDSCAPGARAFRSLWATNDTCKCARNPPAPSKTRAQAPRVSPVGSTSTHFATPAATDPRQTPGNAGHSEHNNTRVRYPNFLRSQWDDALWGVRHAGVSRCDGRRKGRRNALRELSKGSPKHGHYAERSLRKRAHSHADRVRRLHWAHRIKRNNNMLS
jgi:hypothetical protein